MIDVDIVVSAELDRDGETVGDFDAESLGEPVTSPDMLEEPDDDGDFEMDGVSDKEGDDDDAGDALPVGDCEDESENEPCSNDVLTDTVSEAESDLDGDALSVGVSDCDAVFEGSLVMESVVVNSREVDAVTDRDREGSSVSVPMLLENESVTEDVFEGLLLDDTSFVNEGVIVAPLRDTE